MSHLHALEQTWTWKDFLLPGPVFKPEILGLRQDPSSSKFDSRTTVKHKWQTQAKHNAPSAARSAKQRP